MQYAMLLLHIQTMQYVYPTPLHMCAQAIPLRVKHIQTMQYVFLGERIRNIPMHCTKALKTNENKMLANPESLCQFQPMAKRKAEPKAKASGAEASDSIKTS